MATITPPQPKEELAQLEGWLGSQHAIARVLGKTHSQVWKWMHNDQRIQGRNRRLINDTWTFAHLIVERFGERHDLEGVFDARWPELNFRRPADLIRSDCADELLSVLHHVVVVVPFETRGSEPSSAGDQGQDETLYSGVLRALRDGRLAVGAPDRCSDDVDETIARFESFEQPSEEEFALFVEEPARTDVTRGPFRPTAGAS
jgi:hypothetical protein